MFDVKSLFTNVLLKKIINTCAQKLYELEKPIWSKENVKLLIIANCVVRFLINFTQLHIVTINLL